MFDLAAICEREFQDFVAGFNAGTGHAPMPWLHAGLDFSPAAIPEITRLTRAALNARLWFGDHGPDWAQVLPLSLEECFARIRREPGRGYLLGLYSKSLWDLDYDTERHPPFTVYCQGLMAAPPCRKICATSQSYNGNFLRKSCPA
jgi:hypothetical protein